MADEQWAQQPGMLTELYAGALARMSQMELAQHRQLATRYLTEHRQDWAGAAWMIRSVVDDLRREHGEHPAAQAEE